MAKESLADLIGSYDNFDEPIPLANRPTTIIGVCVAMEVLAWSCGLLRLWTRFRILKLPGYDDLFVILSLCLTFMGTIVVCLGASSYGLGEHFLLLGGAEQMSNYLKGFYVANGSYIVATTFIKLALLLQFQRIFPKGTLLYRWTFGLTIFVAFWGLAFTIVTWFPCSPLNEYWSLNPDARCWGFASQNPVEFMATFETHTLSNVALDLAILVLAALMLFTKQELAPTIKSIVGLMFLGVVANFLAVWRFATIVEHKAATSPTFDPSWYGCISILLGALELKVAVICASVPIFWPIIHSTGFKIFITKEVQVTSERRLESNQSEEAFELNGVNVMGGERLSGEEPLQKKESSRSIGRNPFEDDKDDKSYMNVTQRSLSMPWARPGPGIDVTQIDISTERATQRREM